MNKDNVATNIKRGVLVVWVLFVCPSWFFPKLR